MEVDNYTNLEIVSSVTPLNTHLLVEGRGAYSGNLYAADAKVIKKSTDKAFSWSTKHMNAFNFKICYPDWSNDIIYWMTTIGVIREQDLTDDSVDNSGGTGDLSIDVFGSGGNIYKIFTVENANVIIHIYTRIAINNWAVTVNNANMGALGGRTYDASQITIDGTYAYFLWKWSDENVELWRWTIDGAGATVIEIEDCGANTELPPINQRAIAYDGNDVLYFVLQDTGDSKYYLYTYEIGSDTLTKRAEYNIALMLDRNTASGVLEKAFHITSTNIYQLHSSIPYQLHLIASPPSDAVWIAITDSFLMNDNGDMYEYQDVNAYVMEAIINMKKMGSWSASMSILNAYPITQGMFITITDMFTTAGVSASQIIFEGFVTNFTDRFVQVANLISPAQRDLDNEFPEGDYSGRTDEIIVSLLGDHADYITEGTLSAGMAMGTITFGGDKSLREIFDEFALTDHFIWYLTPTGALYYNSGAVDSVENFTAASPITNVNKTFGNRAINYVDIKGGFVSGAQVTGTVAEDIPDQQTNGRNPFKDTFSHLDLAAQCTTINTNVLARLGTQPLIVPFTHNDPTVGVIQCGETVTFEYNLDDPHITSDQFLILECLYDAKQGKANYRISDIVI